MLKVVIFITILIISNLAYSENSANAKVGATIISLDSVNIRKQESIQDRQVQVLSKYGDEGCPTKFFVKIVENNKVTTSEPFGTCSDIAIIKIDKEKVIVSMPNNIGSYTTYIYNSNQMILINK